MTGGMQPKLDHHKLSSEALEAMYAVEQYARKSGLESRLLELVTSRASQFNGCAPCVDIHTKDARRAGAKPSSAFTPLRSGKRLPSAPYVNVLLRPGRKA